MSVVLYSTNCPKCKMLESRLNKFIEFDVVTDNDKILEVAKQYNLKSAPILVIDDKAYTFEQAMKIINDLGMQRK